MHTQLFASIVFLLCLVAMFLGSVAYAAKDKGGDKIIISAGGGGGGGGTDYHALPHPHVLGPSMKGKGKEIGGGSKTQDIGKKVKNPLKNLLDNLSLTRQNWRRQVPRFYVAYKLYQNLLV
ncbi:hypothetical protein TYRP_016741 [Tyrophagus putrescentiae]|nr:hypothetical protein TYRP_016741 [Tyrophagus putrescentiae]